MTRRFALRAERHWGRFCVMGGIFQIVSVAAAAFLAACAGPVAASPDSYSLDSINQVPPAELAGPIIGPELAADVETIEVQHLGSIEQLGSVRFFHRARPLERDICARRVDYVPFMPVSAVDPATPARQVRTRPGTPVEGIQIALAADCRLASGQRFAFVNPGLDVVAAAALLRQLSAARTAASSVGDLPFRLVCEDTIRHDGCRGDGRAALAALPVERTWLLTAIGEPPRAALAIIGEPGQLYWEVRAAASGTDLAELVMVRKVPAPF